MDWSNTDPLKINQTIFIYLKQELANYSPQAKSRPPPVFARSMRKEWFIQINIYNQFDGR